MKEKPKFIKNNREDIKSSLLRLIPLGGIEGVTKNMFVYEYREHPDTISDILIVDCGIGFPDEDMYGIDLVIPDISYLKGKEDKIRAIILTHGHEDHIGALPYILPDLKVPVWAPKLAAALSEVKFRDFGLNYKINVINTDKSLLLGSFKIDFVHVTHSIPDSTNLIIKTKVGIFYHGSDFKFDWSPLDGRQTEVAKIARASSNKILCTLCDCVRVEKEGYTLSEKIIEDSLDSEMQRCQGKFIFTTQSSNISRIQQAINVALNHNRKISFLGRSIRKNVEVSSKLGYLNFPESQTIEEKEIRKYPDNQVFLIATGSQAQPYSALTRIAENSHKWVSIAKGDTVVFSSDPIPGYENAINSLVDALCEKGAYVAYSTITDDLHVSGHGAKNDISLMLGLTNPSYTMPIGGNLRHMKQFSRLAQNMGFSEDQIITPENGGIIEFKRNKTPKVVKKLHLKNIMVDGLGVGDIGSIVLRDRQTMANDGIVIVVVPIDQNTGKITADPDIISRGFVFIKESKQLINRAKKVVKKSLKLKKGRIIDWHFVRKKVEQNLEKLFYKETKRNPLILTVVIKV